MNEHRSRRFPRNHTDVALEYLEKVLALQIAAIEKATTLAKDDMEKRLDGMNEFRDTLKDQASRFVTRGELLAAVVGLSTIISIIVSIVMRMRG